VVSTGLVTGWREVVSTGLVTGWLVTGWLVLAAVKVAAPSPLAALAKVSELRTNQVAEELSEAS
jgi:hypothetical protein